MDGGRKMRKYDIKNKKYIGVILGIALIIIIIFSLFLKRIIDVGKIQYDISSNSIVFDKDKNMITTETDSFVKVKWNGNYYMVYNDDMINLGDHSVIYSLDNGSISLYGKYYEVLNTGDVEILEDENIIASSVKSHFYKLDDRKYLILDRTIESDDGLFVTSNYLLIDIDKSGNATLLNDTVNLKTFQPTILKTSSFTFDVANELLNFGGEDIDLKDIIGTTNEFEKNKAKGKNGSGGGSGDGSGDGSGSGSGGGTGSGAGENATIGAARSGNGTTTSQYNGTTYNRGVSDAAVREIINGTKNTSIIRVASGLSSIVVDYVIYDPKNEYQTVYVDVIDANNQDDISTIYLSKNDTSLTISNLKYDNLYYLSFKYTYFDSNGDLKINIFDNVEVHTKNPNISLVVTGVNSDKLFYKVSLDDYYNIVSGLVTLYVNDIGISNTDIPSGLGSTDGFSSYIDISNVNFSTGDVVKLALGNFQINLEEQFYPNVSFKFIY